MGISKQGKRRAFSIWMRTGRWPRVETVRSVEVKFNPWHDPENGQFTFAGGGIYSGQGRIKPAAQDRPKPADKNLAAPAARDRQGEAVFPFKYDPNAPAISTNELADAWKAENLRKFGHIPKLREAINAQYQVYKRGIAQHSPDSEPQNSSAIRQAAEFYVGEARALYDIGKNTVAGTYALVTDPVTTLNNGLFGLAGMAESAIAEEDTPAYVQISRAADWVANASPDELGHAVGTGAGNVILAIAPEAISAKFTAASRLGKLDPAAVPKGPPKVTWMDEAPTFSGPRKAKAKAYNDSAPGARSNVATKKGQVPALERTMPNGAKRKVRFDGAGHHSVYGHVMIDRKLAITTTKKVRDQAIRQSEALAQHRAIGLWEVPTRAEALRAVKLLKDLEISNIKVRIVKP